MVLQIKKRNGIVVPFDKQRIINAVNKAFIEVDGQLYEEDTARDIADEIKYTVKVNYETDGKIFSVEDIQNFVEDFLMRSERKDVARAYIRYRFKHEIKREGYDGFVKVYSDKINAKAIENQNANVDEMSFGGRVGAGSDYMMKRYALDYCVSDLARRNHENNEIYIHDLSAYAVGQHNCLSVPLDDLLAKGFNTRQTDVRPAGSVNTAMQLVAVLFQLQSLQQFGGVSATHLDWTMVPYVRKSFYKHYRDGLDFVWETGSREPERCFLRTNIDVTTTSIEDEVYKTAGQSHPYDCVIKAYNYAMKMTEREVHQAVEGLYHNLNTLQSRSGNQLN